MTVDPEESGAGNASAAPHIDPWNDRLGALVERFPGFWRRLGDLETRLLAERLEAVRIDRPIYIAGLARSGSTVLLELLARHPRTASHQYRDFPLVLAPWAWNWFIERAGRDAAPPAERAHRDRITVTPQSPEAFEEMVWMTFFAGLHDGSACAVLDETTDNPRFAAFYRDHIRKILALRGGDRYLAKGNYNVTRLRYLRALFPDARFLIPVRDPVWHIASLMKQHRLFAAAGRDDPRVRDHLRRSGHFEFGLDRRPIGVDRDGTGERIARLWRDGEEVAGWAEHWAAVYGHLADALDEPDLAASAMIVRYEDFCAGPGATMATVLEHCALDDAGIARRARATVSAPTYYEPAFSQDELRLIGERTDAVARRFGYLGAGAVNPA